MFPKEVISTMLALKQAGFCVVKIVSQARHDVPTQVNKDGYVGFNFVTACNSLETNDNQFSYIAEQSSLISSNAFTRHGTPVPQPVIVVHQKTKSWGGAWQ